MAYPPTPTPTTNPGPAGGAMFTRAGLTTIVWGTDGLFSATTAAIVISMSETVREEKIIVENGTGFEALIILLNKGVDISIEVVDDMAQTWPTVGVVATLSTPFGSIAGIMEGSSGNQARKREGQMTFTFATYNAIPNISPIQYT